jgi:uncharacterized membrane protein
MANRGRLFSLDALRGFAILNMIVIHFVVYWSSPEGAGKWVQVALNHLTGADFGAACFLMLAGVGQAFAQASRPRPAVSAIRGAYLFGVGLIMLLLAWGPGQLWRWDILTLFGTAALASLALRPLPSWLLLLICLAVAGLTPWLRQGIDLAHYWGGAMQPVPGVSDILPGLLWDPPGGYVSRWDLADILAGFLLMGEFPVFPWIIHPILGLALGRMLLAGRLGPAALRLAWTGLGLTLAGLSLALYASRQGGLSPLTDYLAPLSFYPASFSMVLMQVGAALMVIPLSYYFLDYKTEHASRAGLLGRCLVRVGQASLSVYFGHYMLIAWPLRLASERAGHRLEGDMTSPWLALAVGLGVVLVLQPLLAWWAKRKYIYGLEWCMALMGGKTVR